MAEGGNAGIESQTLAQEVFNVLRFDSFEIAVDRPFRNDDDSLSFSSITMLEERKSVYEAWCIEGPTRLMTSHI